MLVLVFGSHLDPRSQIRREFIFLWWVEVVSADTHLWNFRNFYKIQLSKFGTQKNFINFQFFFLEYFPGKFKIKLFLAPRQTIFNTRLEKPSLGRVQQHKLMIFPLLASFHLLRDFSFRSYLLAKFEKLVLVNILNSKISYKCWKFTVWGWKKFYLKMT